MLLKQILFNKVELDCRVLVDLVTILFKDRPDLVIAAECSNINVLVEVKVVIPQYGLFGVVRLIHVREQFLRGHPASPIKEFDKILVVFAAVHCCPDQ